MRNPAASMTSPSNSAVPSPRRNSEAFARTGVPVACTRWSMPPVWSWCLWVMSVRAMFPPVSRTSASVCLRSFGPGSTRTYSVAPGARSSQVLVPCNVIPLGLSASTTAADGVTCRSRPYAGWVSVIFTS